jgi:hypothetical protein
MYMMYMTLKGCSNLWKHVLLEPEQRMRNHYFGITISHIWLYRRSKLLCVVTFTHGSCWCGWFRKSALHRHIVFVVGCWFFCNSCLILLVYV